MIYKRKSEQRGKGGKKIGVQTVSDAVRLACAVWDFGKTFINHPFISLLQPQFVFVRRIVLLRSIVIRLNVISRFINYSFVVSSQFYISSLAVVFYSQETVSITER
jgi:hypothetical protein